MKHSSYLPVKLVYVARINTTQPSHLSPHSTPAPQMSHCKDIYTPILSHPHTAFHPSLLSLQSIRSAPDPGIRRDSRPDLNPICMHHQAKGEHRSSLHPGPEIHNPEDHCRYYRRSSCFSSQGRVRLPSREEEIAESVPRHLSAKLRSKIACRLHRRIRLEYLNDFEAEESGLR